MAIENNRLTDWTAKEREIDLTWLDENKKTLWSIAQEEYDENGPGALIVNTRERTDDTGYPLGYLKQSIIEEFADEEVIKMVKEYNPLKEFVIIILKDHGRESTYHLPGAKTRTKK